VSLGRRLFDFARSELNSLLDKAARDDDGDGLGGRRLDDMSDDELRAEIERRRREREARAEVDADLGAGTGRADAGAPRQTRSPGGDAGRGGARPRSANAGPRPTGHPAEVVKAYAALELPAGSDFEAVRKQYRSLMRKYHPDRHAQSPEKQKAATQLAQKLGEAYRVLEVHLRGR
jgi:DnaJ-domain-containing protein 1